MCNLISGMKSLSYRQKLTKLRLQSLHARRIRHQLCFMFKMKHRLVDLCFEDIFEESGYKKPRGNIYKLIVPKTKTEYRRNFFACSMIKHWNLLSSADLGSASVPIFLKKVDKYF